MRALLTLLGLGSIGYLIYRETKKPKATTRMVNGVPVTTRGGGQFTSAVRPGAKLIRPGAQKIRKFATVRPGVKKIAKFAQARPAAQKVKKFATLRPGAPKVMKYTATIRPPAPAVLSECSGCGACPPDLQRHVRSCPVAEQDANFYRNLIEPNYGFNV